MRALRALVLFALLAWTAANWFHREPVRRTVSPVHATSRIPLSEHLPEKARAALEPCLAGAPPPMTMDTLVELARGRAGLLTREILERRLVRFLDGKGQPRYLTYRAEAAPQADFHHTLRLFSVSEGAAPAELELDAALKALPPAEAISRLLKDGSVSSDSELVRFRGEGLREWSLETVDGVPRFVRYEEPGLSFECSSAHGPATCSCANSL